MRILRTALTGILAMLLLAACDRTEKNLTPTADRAAISADIPLLPVAEGDTWHYQVHLEIPAGVSSPGASAVDVTFEKIRTYLGAISPANGLPEVDCFEVTVPGSPVEREFVDISEDAILMRGTMIMRPETLQPMWLDHPVPFVIAGMKPGTASPDIRAPGGSLARKIRVVAREVVRVPAGEFPTIRLLMSGSDGSIELRRTIWFSPGTGIVREEKTRHREGQLIFQELQELTATTLKSTNEKGASR